MKRHWELVVIIRLHSHIVRMISHHHLLKWSQEWLCFCPIAIPRMWLRTHCKKPNLPFFLLGLGNVQLQWQVFSACWFGLWSPQPNLMSKWPVTSSAHNWNITVTASSFHNSPSPAVQHRSLSSATLQGSCWLPLHRNRWNPTQIPPESSMCHAIQLSQAVIHLAQTLTTVWDCMWVTSEANDMSISNSNLTSDSLFVRQMANGKAFIPSNNNKILHLKFGQHMSCTKRLKHNVTCLKMIHHTKKLDDCHT